MGSNPSTNTKNDLMEIAIEWEGVSGIVKIVLCFAAVFFMGYFVGRKAN